MRCPECGIEMDASTCERCEREAASHEEDMQAVMAEYSLVRGAPTTADSKASLAFALARIQERLDADGFEGTLKYDDRDLLHSNRCWYVPFVWIGCAGFIVDLDTGYVNWLGSPTNLRASFWGHERGVFHDYVDFTFAEDTPMDLVTELVSEFRQENKRDTTGMTRQQKDALEKADLEHLLASQFPTLKRQFAWFAIPDLAQAWDERGLRFTCSLSAKL